MKNGRTFLFLNPGKTEVLQVLMKTWEGTFWIVPAQSLGAGHQ